MKEIQAEYHNAMQQNKIAENGRIFAEESLSKLKIQLQELLNEREKVLQAAITGSVRLCIVAPTVNVHVADKKLAFRSK